MSTTNESIYGTIGWIDLTVPEAEAIKDFYVNVTGWEPQPVSMGDYHDYSMMAHGEPRAGICHKRGANSDIPSQWMIYINVRDLEHSRALCETGGGELITDIKDMGEMGRYCFIRDPAGAVFALFEPKG